MACLGVGTGWTGARRTRTAERAPRRVTTSAALVSMYCLPRGAHHGSVGEDDWRPSNLRASATRGTGTHEVRTSARARARLQLERELDAVGDCLVTAAMVLSVGRYKLGTVLRADAQCMVRVCTDKQDNNCEYTVRVLEKNNVRRRGKASALAIKNEVAAMTEMHHNNILRLHDVVTTVERLYLVHERVHGEDLGAYVLRRGPLHPTHAQELIRAVARALDHAHKRGVYHGSLAPSRIIVPKDGSFSNAKVFEFGIFVPNDITLASANDALALAAILALVIAAAPPPLPKTAPDGARLLYTALQHPDPARRPTMADVLRTPWLCGKQSCGKQGSGLLMPPAPLAPASPTYPKNVELLKTMDVLPQRTNSVAHASHNAVSHSARLEASNTVRLNSVSTHSSKLKPSSDTSSSELFTDAADSFATGQTNSNEHRVSETAKANDPELIDNNSHVHQSSSSSSATGAALEKLTIESPTRCTISEFSSPVTLPSHDPLLDDDDIPPFFASSAISLRYVPDTKVAHPKVSLVASRNSKALDSSSTISSASDGESLMKMVQSVLPKYSPRKTRRVVQKLNKAGVDNTDDIRFVISSVGGCKNAADWFERVTDLSPIVCLRVTNAVDLQAS